DQGRQGNANLRDLTEPGEPGLRHVELPSADFFELPICEVGVDSAPRIPLQHSSGPGTSKLPPAPRVPLGASKLLILSNKATFRGGTHGKRNGRDVRIA